MFSNFIQNNGVANIVIGVLVSVFYIALACSVFELISDIRKYIRAKTDKTKEEIGVIKASIFQSYHDLVAIIEDAISLEVTNKLNTYAVLETRYPVQQLDVDVSIIAKKVYDGLDKNVIFLSKLPITEKYIMQLITSITARILINASSGMNNTLDKGLRDDGFSFE